MPGSEPTSKLLRHLRQAAELSRTGAVVINDGEAAVYFTFGQPSHAWARRGDEPAVEGDAALRVIALRLTDPRQVRWDGQEMTQRETLHCTAGELEQTLGRIGRTSVEPPPLSGRRRRREVEQRGDGRPRYSLADYPLLPTGVPLWENVPSTVVHLDVMLRDLPTVLLEYRAEGVLGAGVVRDGALVDGIVVDGTGMRVGSAATEWLLAGHDGLLSAYHVSDRLADVLPILWHGRPVHQDIDTRWIDSQRFLEALRRDGDDRAVVVSGGSASGVVLYDRGELIACYTSANRHPTHLLGEIHALAGTDLGSISVLARTEPESRATPESPVQAPIQPLPLADTMLVPEAKPEPSGSPFTPAPVDPPAAIRAAAPLELSSVVFHPGGLREPAIPAGEGSLAPALLTLQPAGGAGDEPGIDFTPLIEELVRISRAFLGADAVVVEPTIRGAEPTVPGLRATIAAVKQLEVPPHEQTVVRSMARAMQIFVAERCSAG